MREQRRSRVVDDWAFRLDDRYERLPADDLRQQAALSDMLSLSNDRVEARRQQAGFMATVTAMVVAGLLLIWFLDHPHRDQDGSIEPIEMERALSAMQEEHGSVPIPCTPSGLRRPV